MGFQNVIIQGNLGKDVDLRATKSGKSVATFPVAVDEGFGDNKNTTWFNVVAWEKTADACGKFLAKGSKVLVSGRIQVRSYDDRDGNKRQAWELVAARVEFLGDVKPREEGRESRPAQRDDEPPFSPDDNIPF